MKSHELARILLSLPDSAVITHAVNHSSRAHTRINVLCFRAGEYLSAPTVIVGDIDAYCFGKEAEARMLGDIQRKYADVKNDWARPGEKADFDDPMMIAPTRLSK